MVLIEKVDGFTFEQEVVSEWVPPFCSKSNKLGHDCVGRNAPKKNVVKRVLNSKPSSLIKIVKGLAHSK